LERGKVTLQSEAVNLVVLLQDVVAFYGPKLAERKLTCTTVIPNGPPPDAWADPEKIRQVLVNLLSNAIKFTPENGTVEVGVRAENEHLIVYVRDSGVGIAPESQVKIFSKFEQVHSARQNVKGPKGTGLGLSIAKALVEMHGGRLELESKPEEGSCFYFTLQKQGELS
jgi:signal transduction histidine kinase